jgi:hypothetical protein
MTGGWVAVEVGLLAVIAAAAVALVAMVRRGGRQIDAAMTEVFGTDDGPSNVRVIDAHRAAAACTLPACPIHGEAS